MLSNAAKAIMGAAASAAAAGAAEAEVGDGEQLLADGVHEEARECEGGHAQRAPRGSQKSRLTTCTMAQSEHVSRVEYFKPKPYFHFMLL